MVMCYVYSQKTPNLIKKLYLKIYVFWNDYKLSKITVQFPTKIVELLNVKIALFGSKSDAEYARK
jgi:hypothetical protein